MVSDPKGCGIQDGRHNLHAPKGKRAVSKGLGDIPGHTAVSAGGVARTARRI